MSIEGACGEKIPLLSLICVIVYAFLQRSYRQLVVDMQEVAHSYHHLSPHSQPSASSANEFVYLSGEIDKSYVYVHDLNMEFPGYLVSRDVQQCQWHRTKYTERDSEGVERTKYKYYAGWSSSPITSIGWDGLHNNFWDYSIASGTTATSVFLGNYKIDVDIIMKTKPTYKPDITSEHKDNFTHSTYYHDGLRYIGDGVFFRSTTNKWLRAIEGFLGRDSNMWISSCTVGDVKVTVRVADSDVLSVMGRRSGMTITPGATESGSTVGLIEEDAVSADKMMSGHLSNSRTASKIVMGIGIALTLVHLCSTRYSVTALCIGVSMLCATLALRAWGYSDAKNIKVWATLSVGSAFVSLFDTK